MVYRFVLYRRDDSGRMPPFICRPNVQPERSPCPRKGCRRQNRRSWRGRLAWLTSLVVRFPVPVLALAVGRPCCFAGVLSGSRLGFRTSRLDLLNPDSSYNRLWIDYINEFGDEDDVVVVVEGASREQVVPVLEEISTALAREDRLFHAVLHEVDLSKIRSKGLHYLPPEQARRRSTSSSTRRSRSSRGDWTRLNLGNMVGAMSCPAGRRRPPRTPEARRRPRPSWTG